MASKLQRRIYIKRPGWLKLSEALWRVKKKAANSESH